MKLIVDYILLTFENFPSCDIIGSKAQQHSSVSVEVSSNISNHSDHTSSSNDAISENKENDKKRRKLDHLIDSTALPYITEYTSFKGKITLQSLQFYLDDWNVARSLYSIADIQSCIDKVRPVGFGENLNLYELEVTAAYGSGYCNWMIDCGGEKCHHHPRYKIYILSPFDETVLNNADVIILSDLRDKDGARFETILIEIEIVLGMDVYRETAKMYLPDNLIHHQDMFGQSLLYYASRADSSLQEKYQEPCVVFAGHLSLRSGAAINSLESGEIIQTIQ
ncbi:uncharacterized protein OCT59_014841 [Rhizophagus irregularis]|uniref:uncharacterized protein n=1 Tax=Rhizophagus irregularis TaxID=588596 RepID=UPI0033188558|nr:hypothetical protein OCT59_014841 [Rhizophagus irregularis]